MSLTCVASRQHHARRAIGAGSFSASAAPRTFCRPTTPACGASKRACATGFERFGYQGIQTPIIEPLELFLRKSGDEIVARMYSFSHWNRRLCLRPEVTASVMRAFVDQLQGHGLPLRVHYAGPIFRYERPSRGRSRQFTVGGRSSSIGASGAAADAEVLHLACAGLAIARDQTLSTGRRPSRRHACSCSPQLGMTDHAQGLVLDQMESIARGRIDLDAAVARVAGLLGGDAGHGPNGTATELPPGLASLPPEQATAIAADILSRASLPVEGGARQPSEIIQRLLAKARRPDPTDQVRKAVRIRRQAARRRRTARASAS